MPALPFKQKLIVREKNRLIEFATIAAMVLGVAMFVGFLGLHLPAGYLGIHVFILASIFNAAQRRRRMRPTRREREVDVSADGVRVGDELIRRSAISDGYFQPWLPPTRWQKGSVATSAIRLLDKRRRVLFEAEAEQQAVAMLEALRLDVASKRAEFWSASPLYATFGRNLAFSFGVIAALSALRFLIGHVGPVAMFAFLPLMLAAMIPGKVVVGVDGIHIRWLWRKKFIPMADILGAYPESDRVIRLRLASGDDEVIYTSNNSNWRASLTQDKRQHRDAILARILEASTAYRAKGAMPDVAMLVGRGRRTHDEWKRELELLKKSDRGYRHAAIRDEDLWRVVEDPRAPEDARAGAAMLLRADLDEEGKARVRVAAEATASPKLRVALDAAAKGSDTEAAEALDDLAPESEVNLRRAGGA